HKPALEVEPEATGGDFARARPQVQPALATRGKLEVLDRVGDVGPPAVDADPLQRLLEDAPGRSDKGSAGKVLLVARLLADEHRVGPLRPLPEHRLRGERVERAASACLD